jgi:PAS domain S-box-containing protein
VDGESRGSQDSEPVAASSSRPAFRSSDLWRGLFESVLSGFALHDSMLDEAGAPVDYVFVSANRAFGEQTGLVPAEILGRRVTDVLPGVEKSGLIELYGQVALGGAPQRFEIYFEPLGRHYDIQVFSPRRGQFATVFVDVTERRRAEDDLEENRRFLQRVLEVTPDLIYIFDLASRRNVFSNREMLEVLGYTSDEVLAMGGTVVPRLLHPDDAQLVAEHYAKAAQLADDETAEVEYRMRRRDGTWCWLHCRDSVFRRSDDGAAVHLIGTAQDITARRQAEAARREAERALAVANVDLERRVSSRTRELEAAYEELEAFSYSVSHDLRAPLRALDGFSLALLEDYGEQLDDTARDYLARVRAASQRMGRLIDDLLTLSRVSRQDLVREEVDLSAIGRDVIADLRQADPKRLVEVTVADGIVANGDPSLLRVVLRNLLDNAWKFTSRRPHAHIEVGVERRGGVVAHEVRDDGAGFDTAYVDKLFTPFQRLHAADEFPGTGIGLATVRRIVRRHGGSVWAEGAVDSGATIRFTLDQRGMDG